MAAQQPGGGLGIGGNTEQHRLHRNGISFHTLTLDELRAACIGLSEVVLLPGMNTVIDLDHQLLWAWMGQVLLAPAPEAEVFSNTEREIAELFSVCIRASLAGIRPPVNSHEEWEAQNQRFHIEELNARALVQQSHLVLAFLALPILEAVAKKASSNYVDYSGAVLQPWSVPRRGGSGTQTYSIGDQCNSVRHLLHLLRNTVAGPDLRAGLDDMRANYYNLDPSMDAFDAIYMWRNRTLHGQTTYPTIGGSVLNMALLISLEFISNNYEARRDRQVERCLWEQQIALSTGTRVPWSYYPPFPEFHISGPK